MGAAVAGFAGHAAMPGAEAVQGIGGFGEPVVGRHDGRAAGSVEE